MVTGDPTNENYRAGSTLSFLEEGQSLGAQGRKLLRSRHAISVQNKQLPPSKQMMWAAADLQNSSFGLSQRRHRRTEMWSSRLG